MLAPVPNVVASTVSASSPAPPSAVDLHLGPGVDRVAQEGGERVVARAPVEPACSSASCRTSLTLRFQVSAPSPPRTSSSTSAPARISWSMFTSLNVSSPAPRSARRLTSPEIGPRKLTSAVSFPAPVLRTQVQFLGQLAGHVDGHAVRAAPQVDDDPLDVLAGHRLSRRRRP